MLDLLHRTNGSGVAEKTMPTFTPEYSPPEHLPPITPHTTAPWPRNAKVLVAILLVAAVLGAMGTIIGFTTGDDQTATEQENRETIETLTAERNDLVAQVTELQADLDTTVAERDELSTQLTALEATSDAVIAERDDLVDQLATLELTTDEVTAIRDGLVEELAALEATSDAVIAERNDLIDQLAGLDARIDTLAIERARALVRIDVLEADLLIRTQALTATQAELKAITDLFPITFDASLVGVDLIGTYDLTFDEVYCTGFTTCGTVPDVDEAVIRSTPQGWLNLEIDGLISAGLFRVDGALYAIADHTVAAPGCGTTPQPARVAVAIYPQGLTVTDDGGHSVKDLGATITVDASATAACPSGLAFYGAEMLPQR